MTITYQIEHKIYWRIKKLQTWYISNENWGHSRKSSALRSASADSEHVQNRKSGLSGMRKTDNLLPFRSKIYTNEIYEFQTAGSNLVKIGRK